MKNEFVPYDLALCMKELGFDEPCFGFYSLHDGNKAVGGNYPCDGTNSAPLYQQAFRWFREEYGWTIKINQILKDEWSFTLENFIIERELFGGRFKTYEEAQDSCLRKLIEIVKENNNE